MNNDWIRHLAADIADRFNRPQAERMLEDVIREAVRNNAPDAESLAVALEAILTAHDSDAASGGELWYAEVLSPIVSKQRSVIAAHRAAHPAHVSTDSSLGNK